MTNEEFVRQAYAVAEVKDLPAWVACFNPDGVFVDAQERRDTVALLIHASPGDLGRIIGKRGRVIQAVRQLVRAAGSADGVKANVDVVE